MNLRRGVSLYLAILLITVLLAACGGGGGDGSQGSSNPPGGGSGSDQTGITLSSNSLVSQPGQNAVTTLTITPQSGLSGTVSLSLEKQDGSPVPAGLSLSPTSVNVTGQTSFLLTISVANDVSAGTYYLRIKATSGNVIRIADFFLVVQDKSIGGNVNFVAVGDGIILTSPDGTTWTQRSMPESIRGITFGKGMFVAVGFDTLMTSNNGVDWTSRITGVEGMFKNFESVTYGNNLFVAVGTTIHTSTDGVSWSQQYFPNAELVSVTYGNGKFVAVGYNVESGIIFTSSDGINWTKQTIKAKLWPYDATYGNGKFVVVGWSWADNKTIYFTSTDGLTWTEHTPVNALVRGITFGNNLFIAVGNAYIATSKDGINWQRTDAPSLEYCALYRVAYGKGKFVAVGTSGYIFVSNDGIHWTLQHSGPSGVSLRGVAIIP